MRQINEEKGTWYIYYMFKNGEELAYDWIIWIDWLNFIETWSLNIKNELIAVSYNGAHILQWNHHYEP
jgi:hypothetical protein